MTLTIDQIKALDTIHREVVNKAGLCGQLLVSIGEAPRTEKQQAVFEAFHQLDRDWEKLLRDITQGIPIGVEFKTLVMTDASTFDHEVVKLLTAGWSMESPLLTGHKGLLVQRFKRPVYGNT